MKYLIVNADDFGASRGVNRGIVECHRFGIVTSASLMVDQPGAEEAAAFASDLPDLSVGLHFALTNEEQEFVVDPKDLASCRAELIRQFERFRGLTGRLPTHLDSHHHVHNKPELGPLFVSFSEEQGLSLRMNSEARYFGSFYGQWDGVTHLEQIGVESLTEMLHREVDEGVTEFGCHPGYIDSDFTSSYSIERETEVRTLVDARIRAVIAVLDVKLIGFRDLARSGCRNPEVGMSS